jgi:hypothetical protein
MNNQKEAMASLARAVQFTEVVFVAISDGILSADFCMPANWRQDLSLGILHQLFDIESADRSFVECSLKSLDNCTYLKEWEALRGAVHLETTERLEYLKNMGSLFDGKVIVD